MTKKCKQCKENKAEYVFLDVPACRKCLKEYYLEFECYEMESFEDFLMGMNKIQKGSEK